MKQSGRSIVGFLFGMLFVVSGSWVTYDTAIRTIITYFASADWERTSGELLDLDFKTNYGSESITYTVKASYNYYYNGTQYTGSRVNLTGGSDNLGSYWRDIYNQLENDRRMQRLAVWVNPDNPSEAVLDRSFRWTKIGFGAVFALLFIGLGGVVAWFSIKKSVPISLSQIKAIQSTGIRSNEKAAGWAGLGFGGIFFFMGLFFSAMAIPEALEKGEYGALFVLVFVIVGAAIMWPSLKLLLSYTKHGVTPLFLDPQDPGVGGDFGAKFALSSAAVNTGNLPTFTAQLKCIRRYRSGDDTRTSVIWSDSLPTVVKQSFGGIDVYSHFKIPSDCIPSREWSRGSAIEWELEVKADKDSPNLKDFSRSWEVYIKPVASVLNSSISIPEATLKQARENSLKDAMESARQQIPITESGYDITVQSKALRTPLMSLGGIIFGAIFMFVGSKLPEHVGWMGKIFMLLGGVVSAFSLYAAGNAIDAIFNTAERSLSIKRSWFGIVYSTKRVDVLSRDQFTTGLTSTTTGGREEINNYALYISVNGKRTRIAEGIQGEAEAEAVLQRITDYLF